MKEAETRAGEALRELLEKIPILHVEGIDAEAVSGDWEPDLIARLLVEGGRTSSSASSSRTDSLGTPGPRCWSCGTTLRTEPSERRPFSSLHHLQR